MRGVRGPLALLQQSRVSDITVSSHLFLLPVARHWWSPAQLEEDESEEEEIEETRIQGRENIPVYEKTIRCRSGSGWYNVNAQHALTGTAQTISSRVPPFGTLIQVCLF